MKTLIICEGKHDSIFLKKILNKMGLQDTEFRIFDQSGELPKIKNAESKEISKFLESTSPYKFLVKSEGGNSPAVKIFCSNVSHCLESIDRVIFMIDLDGRSHSQKISELQNIINTRMPRTLMLEVDHNKQNDHFNYSFIKVNSQHTMQFLGNLHALFFKRSLEFSCEISRDDRRNTSIVENKILNFIDNTQILNFVLPIFSE